MTDFLFIRHGQTEWNRVGRWQGTTDIPLNEWGQRQAARLAERLCTWPIDHIYSSHLLRAHATAKALAAPHGLSVTVDPEWRERSAGALEGLSRADLKRDYPEFYARMQRGHVNPPGGESAEQLRVRVQTAFDALVERHTEGTIAIVSHGGTIAAAVGHVLGLSLDTNWRVSLRGNTSMTRITMTERGPRLTLLNDTAHLEGMK